MTHRGPFQPLPFCDSVILLLGSSVNELRQAEVKIISTQICNRREVYSGAITAGMLCAGYLEGQVDACQVSLFTGNSKKK